MLVSGRTQMLSRFPVDTILEMFSKLGFDSVEFCLTDLGFHIRPDLLENYIIEHNVEKANDLKLPITAVSNHLAYYNDDYVFEQNKKAIPKIKKFGTNVFIIAAGGISAKERLYNKELRQVFYKRTAELCQLANGYGVTLAIEPEPGQLIARLDDFYELKSQSGCENIKLNFDVGHAFLLENSLHDAILRCGNDIAHCHLENMKRGEHLHMLPQEGDIDMLSALKTLHSVGFKGGMSLDLYVLPYEETAEESVRYVKGLLQEVNA